MPVLYSRLLRAFQVATILLHLNPLRLCPAARMFSRAIGIAARLSASRVNQAVGDLEEWIERRRQLAETERRRVLEAFDPCAMKPQEIVVFVCGTTYPNLALADPIPILEHRQVPKDSPYRSMVEKSHHHPLFTTLGHPTMGMGMLPIPLFERGEESVLCARHIATAYEVMSCEAEKKAQRVKVPRLYVSFLRSNLLSYHAREEDAQELYDRLITLKQYYGKKVRLTLVCHSYGGRVGLNLAAECCDDKEPLFIDRLVLIGTPLQRDVLPLLRQERFGEVIGIHSDGDKVVYNDVFSTGGLPCLGSLTELFDDARERGKTWDEDDLPVIIDLRLVARDDPAFYDHSGMWSLGYPHREQTILGPYPPSVLLPQILYMVETYRKLHSGRVHLGLDVELVCKGKLALGAAQDMLVYDLFRELARLCELKVASYDPVSLLIGPLAHPLIRNGVIVKSALGV